MIFEIILILELRYKSYPVAKNEATEMQSIISTGDINALGEGQG